MRNCVPFTREMSLPSTFEHRRESREPGQPRRCRADARQNVDALLEAAKAIFAESGVDAPVRAIAERAGVGVGTLYRHFPLRSDLISAVFRREMDACVAAAIDLEADLPSRRSARPVDHALHPVRRNQTWSRRSAALRRPRLRAARRVFLDPPRADASSDCWPAAMRCGRDRPARSTRANSSARSQTSATGAAQPALETSGRAERMVRLLLAGLRH